MRHHVLKFANNCVIVSLLRSDNPDHGPVVVDFRDWCRSTFLGMNVSKIEDMTIGFKKNATVISPDVINDQAFEFAQQYKYIGTVIDDKLTFKLHLEAVCRKAYQCMQACVF